jgi:hypothetical protein
VPFCVGLNCNNTNNSSDSVHANCVPPTDHKQLERELATLNEKSAVLAPELALQLCATSCLGGKLRQCLAAAPSSPAHGLLRTPNHISVLGSFHARLAHTSGNGMCFMQASVALPSQDFSAPHSLHHKIRIHLGCCESRNIPTTATRHCPACMAWCTLYCAAMQQP